MSIDDIMGLFGTSTVQTPITDLLTIDLNMNAPQVEASNNSDDGFGDFEDF